MGKCDNQRYRDMLHRYELGQLPLEDQDELEHHLLLCDECFKDFLEFQTAVEHIRFSDRVKEVVNSLAEKEKDKTTVPDKSRKFNSFLIPLSIITVVTIFILVLNPWQIEFRPSGEAIASENRLAVVNFENLIDPSDAERLGEITASLLITDLIDSRYIQVVSSQMILDILQRLNYQEKTSLDAEEATRLAKEARAKWLITGKILQVQPSFVFIFEISDIHDGHIIAAERITGMENETLFSLVDRIAVKVRQAIKIPNANIEDTDRLVADITTHSAEAYRLYLEGIVFLSRFFVREANIAFHEALAIDSTFAMAYYYLSRYENPEFINQAVKYSEQTTQLGKFYIESYNAFVSNDLDSCIDKLKVITEEYPDEKMAFYDLSIVYYNQSQFEKSKELLLRAIDIDPDYKEAINSLAYTYDKLGDFENSILAINRYIDLAPHEPNPYDSRGDLYSYNGKPDKAIESYLKALEIKPDFYESMRKLGHMYLFQREFDKAQRCYLEIAPTADSGFYLRRIYPVLISYYRGEFEQALVEIDSIIDVQVAREETAAIYYSLRIKALIYYQQGKISQALDAMQQSIKTFTEVNPLVKADDRYLLVQFLEENDNFERAERLIDSIEIDIAESASEMFRYWYALGTKLWAEGEIEDARDAMEVADKLTIGSNNRFPVGYTLGRIYLELGQYEQAVTILEDITSDYGESLRLCMGPWSVKAHYYLGLAYENSKWYQKAIDQYQIFLEFWAKPDMKIEEVEDARERLTELKSNM